MKIKELLEARQPSAYVYHASYLPNLAAGLKSIKQNGLLPSKSGYSGRGVYFAYAPNEGFYHVSKDEATMFRAKWSDLVDMYGTYPSNKNGIQKTDDEIIVPKAVPSSILEVEYFPGEYWDIDSALSAETHYED